MDASPWFPDYVAKWYDQFYEWRGIALKLGRLPDGARRRLSSLIKSPHKSAAVIDQIIDQDEPSEEERARRLLRGLQLASEAFQEAGVNAPRAGGAAWDQIRAHFGHTGNLLRNSPGFLLPQDRRRFGWTPSPEKKIHDVRWHFPGFARYVPPPDLRIDLRVLPTLAAPIEKIRSGLKIAVVPLIESIDDFLWQKVDGAQLKFRVSLKDAAAASASAVAAIEAAGAEQCDVVLFPELCLTPAMQSAVGDAIAATARKDGVPWLVVAGTAHTETSPGSEEFTNRAVVFDTGGRRILDYDKLHPYEMSTREADQYGLAHAVGDEARVEDIVVPHPRRLAVVETVIGRIAVLICEDLSVIDQFIPVVKGLAVDWLLVPVLDGIQRERRWTWYRAGTYAAEGTSVVVATSKSVVEAHRAFLSRDGSPIVPCGVGILATAGDLRIQTFVCTSQHDVPVTLTLKEET